MRKGFTTSTCAAASTLASLYMLINGNVLDYVVYRVPAGYTILFPIEKIVREKDRITSCIRKDAGDDPDVTDNILICSRVRFIQKGIIIKGGEGVGIVEKPGLFQSIGEPAINPSARSMIEDVVKSLVPSGRGVEVEIMVPEGKKIAKGTYNAKIGIKDGISILGTTGMVEPMSETAWIKTILLEERIKKAEGKEYIVLVMGNYGMDFAKRDLHIDEDYIVKISGYVGDALKGAYEAGFRNMLLIGQVGKMIKVSGGIFNVHNKVADGRFEVLGFYLFKKGFPREKIDEILSMTTIERASRNILEYDKEFFTYIAERVTEKIRFYINGENLLIGSLIYSLNKGFLGMDNGAKVFLERFVKGAKNV